MSVPTFNQYVLPQTPHQVDGVSGVIDIRISRGLYAWNLIDTHPDQVLTLDSANRLINKFSPPKKAFADVDGDLSADMSTLVLSDVLSYSGTSNGTTYSENLSAAQASLLWKIFESDPTVTVFQVWRTFMPTPKNGQYSAGTSYTVGQTVAFRGKTYKCTASTTGNSPVNVSTGVVNTTWWAINYDIYFGGDVDMNNVGKVPMNVHKPRTSSQLELNTWTLNISPMVNRSKKGTIGMLVDSATYPAIFASEPNAPTNVPFAQSDMVQFSAAHPGDNSGGSVSWTTTTRPFYAGIISRDVRNGGVGALSPYDLNVRTSNTWFGADMLGYMGIGFDSWSDSLFDTTWPHFMWGIKPATCLAKAANLLGIGFDATTDFTSAFTFYGQSWYNTNFSYNLNTVSLDNLALCFNAVFGVSPINSGPKLWNNPLAFAPDTTIADFYKAFAYMFGCYVWHTIDQTTGQFHIQLLSRRTSFGTVPSNWKMKKGFPKKEASIIAKDYVSIKNKLADGELRCPAINSPTAQGIEIMMPLRVRPMGGIGIVGDLISQKVFTANHQLVNDNWAPNNQGPAGEIIDSANTPPLRADGWLCGAFLYEIKTSTNNDRYPPEWVGRSSFNSNLAPSDPWDGFVAIAAMTENDSLTLYDSTVAGTIANSRADAYNAPAQLLARDLLDNKVVFTVEYRGVSDGNGKLSGIVPGMEDSWAPPGSTGVSKTFRAIEVEPDDLKCITKVKFIPKPVYTSLPDLSTLFVGPSSNTSSGSGRAPTSTPPGSSPAPHSVVDNPNGGGQNNITAQTTTTVGLRHTRLSGSTVDFEQWIDESSSVLGKIDKNGNITFQAATLNGALDMSTHLVHNVVDPVSAQDAATKHYVDAATTSLGTVTSVGLSLPGMFTVSGSPVTSTGTLTAALAAQSANLVFAGPSSGGSAAPTFRALSASDMPSGLVKTAPTAIQKIIPSSASNSALELQGQTSQSANIFVIRQDSTAIAAYFDGLGGFNSNVAIQVNVSSGNFATFYDGAHNIFTFSTAGLLTIRSSGTNRAISITNGVSENAWFKADGSSSQVGDSRIGGALTLVGGLISSGRTVYNVVTLAAASTFGNSEDDHFVYGDCTTAAFTTTMAGTPPTGVEYVFYKKDATAHNWTINNNGGGLIKTLIASGQTVRITYDGATWRIV